MMIGGVVFGFFAGYSYWFPKFLGFKLNEQLGKYAVRVGSSASCSHLSRLYLLGFMGATRRLNHYDVHGLAALIHRCGHRRAVILAGVGFQVLQVIVSIKQRKQNMDTTGDPWNGRTLEWSTVIATSVL